MCICGKPVINGQPGYKWNRLDEPNDRIHPVNPPDVKESDKLLRDEPGRCGGLDSHSFHFRLVNNIGPELLVRHGGGDERIRLTSTVLTPLLRLDSTDLYWTLCSIYHAHADGKREGSQRTEQRWRQAAAEKRIKTRKQPGRNSVKVWIVEKIIDAPVST
jgi:hypothetical protein